jgi:adenylate cyclase
MRRSLIHQRIAERGITAYGERTSEIAAELAMHFEQSRDWPRALKHILHAAENAAARSAHHEAVDLVNRGLEAVKFLPETDEHAKQEMKLRMILSVSLMALKGFASAEVERINARGRELFWRHGPSPELFYMLWSLNFYQQFSGELRSSLESSYQLMQLAEDLKDGPLTMEAHRSIAAVLVLLGRCSEALEHIEKGEALYSTHRNQQNRVFVSFDSKVMFDCFGALALLALGYPDQSTGRLTSGLALARTLAHPETLVVAGHVAAQIHHLRGEPALVCEYAKEAMELAEEYGLAIWRAYGLVELGWAEAELGNSQTGIQKMQLGMAEYEATGAKLRSPYFMGLLADQLGKTGQVEEGLEAITKALKLAELTGEGYTLAEMYRIKGELILKNGDRVPASKRPVRARSHAKEAPMSLLEAQSCFAESAAVAKRQQTRSWELKAAISLYGLQSPPANPPPSELASIYSSFTEGFETADLKKAKALLSGAGLSV